MLTLYEWVFSASTQRPHQIQIWNISPAQTALENKDIGYFEGTIEQKGRLAFSIAKSLGVSTLL